MTKESFLFGYNGKRKTLAEMNQSKSWTGIHPEARRRYLAIMQDCPHDLGFGNGFRTREQQEWSYQNSAGAKPGNSYHEATDPLGYSYAVDFLNYQPAIGWAHANCHLYGLYHFGRGPNGKDVNNDAPHFQLVELPVAKRDFRPNVHTLRHWNLPGVAAPRYVSPFPAAILRPGDRNAAVRTLQHELKNWSKNPGPIDGIYGANTTSAVRLGQQEVAANGFDPGPFDGYYGPLTRAAFDRYYQARGWGMR